MLFRVIDNIIVLILPLSLPKKSISICHNGSIEMERSINVRKILIETINNSEMCFKNIFDACQKGILSDTDPDRSANYSR